MPGGFSDVLADEIALAREPLLDLVERDEQRAEGLLISRLRGGETRPIDAVVDVLVDERVDAVDLLPQRWRIIVRAHIGETAERIVEHADDLGRFVVDDGTAFLVPQHRHADTAAVARIGAQIDLGELACAVHGVRSGAGARPEAPAVRAVERLDDRHRDHFLEPLERAHDRGTVRPWAGKRHIEMIAVARGGKAAFARRPSGAILRDPVAKPRSRANEAPIRRALAVLLVPPDAVDQKAHGLFLFAPVGHLIIGAAGGTSFRDGKQLPCRQWTSSLANAKRPA